MNKISKLSCVERKLLIEKYGLLDQIRNLKVTVVKERDKLVKYNQFCYLLRLIRGKLILDISKIEPMQASFLIDCAKAHAKQI